MSNDPSTTPLQQLLEAEQVLAVFVSGIPAGDDEDDPFHFVLTVTHESADTPTSFTGITIDEAAKSALRWHDALCQAAPMARR